MSGNLDRSRSLYTKTEDEPVEGLLISNNLLDGCGMTNFWQPGAVWVEGLNNISVVNNEVCFSQSKKVYRILLLHLN